MRRNEKEEMKGKRRNVRETWNKEWKKIEKKWINKEWRGEGIKTKNGKK